MYAFPLDRFAGPGWCSDDDVVAGATCGIGSGCILLCTDSESESSALPRFVCRLWSEEYAGYELLLWLCPLLAPEDVGEMKCDGRFVGWD